MPRTLSDWEFIEEPHIGVLSIPRPGQAPHATPIWYWTAGDDVEFTVPRTSAKARLIGAGTPVALTVHDGAYPYRYVTVEGIARVDRDRTVDDLRFVATRYFGAKLAEGYVATVTSDGVICRLSVEKLSGVDFR